MKPRTHFVRGLARIVRPNMLKALSDLQACGEMSQEAVEKIQLQKLNRLLAHHLATPSYRELCVDGVGKGHLSSLAELSRFPVADKDFLRRCYELGPPANAARALSTSGSSGKNLWFYQSREMLDASTAALWHCSQLMGVDAWSDRKIGIWGQSPPSNRLARISLWAKCVVANIAVLQGYGLDEEKALSYLEHVRRKRPRLLYGYPSYLHFLAYTGREHGVPAPEVSAILCSGEQMQEHHRREIESYFGKQLYNRYGCREFSVIAHETPEHRGLYVPPTRFYVEADDSGELLITDLDNYATPFIRYAIGDLGEVRPADSVLGRPGQCIADIQGRVHDVLKTPSGKMLPGQFWTLLSRSVPGILEFQVAQTARDRIEFRIVAGDDYQPGKEPHLIEHFKEIADDEMALDIRRIDRIERTSMGKRRFVVRECEGQDAT